MLKEPDPCLSGSLRSLNPVLKEAGIPTSRPHPLAKLDAVNVGRVMFLRKNCAKKIKPPCFVDVINGETPLAMDALGMPTSRPARRKC